MDDFRPKFLSILEFRFPVTAIVSIGQRITGVLLLFGLPFVLFFLDMSLIGVVSFVKLQELFMVSVGLRLGTWLFLSAFVYHVVGGLRHLIMDIGIGESLKVAKFTACVTLFLSIVVAVILGVYLW